jgi:MoxR-like ATPase
LRYWKISPGEQARLWDEAKENDCIFIGWCYGTDWRKTKFGDLTKNPDKELIKRFLMDYYKKELKKREITSNQITTWANIIKDFLEIKPRDKVVVYDKKFHINAICEVTGDYKPNKEIEYSHTKPVKWIKIFDPPLDIKPIKDNKLKNKISLNKTVVELTEKDWDIIYNYAMGGGNMPRGNEDVKYVTNLLNKNLNVILYGPPGTGKTYLANKVKAQYKSEFVTFHQSYSYEDFIEGIKPKTHDENGKKEIYYEIEDGLFKRLCKEAIKNAIEKSNLISKDILNSSQFFKDFFEEYEKLNEDERRELFENADKFLLIIDEINRGNISKIFGELITFIEKDKRLGEGKNIVTLPYSKEKFGVPPNVLLLGTMNTADRSIALLDIALRRRFYFYPMWPKAELLGNVDGIDLNALLSSMNDKIAELHDRDRQIGHSYFYGVEDLEELKYVWFYRIMPLLQEYFYDDDEKIKDIVGEEFTNKGWEMEDTEFRDALKRISGGKIEEEA